MALTLMLGGGDASCAFALVVGGGDLNPVHAMRVTLEDSNAMPDIKEPYTLRSGIIGIMCWPLLGVINEPLCLYR